MAHFFSLQDGSLTNISTYGYSLTGAEIMNNTTGTMLLTSGGNIYSSNGFSDGSTISAIAVHLSARAANPTGTLGLTLQRTASAGVFLDSSSNNFSITTVGSAYQNTFTPFSPNGWSGYFNGTTDYLTVSSSSFAFGTNNFTIEFWIYPLAYGGSIIGGQIFGTANGIAGTGYSINLGESQNRFRIISNAGGTWAENLVVNGPNLNEWTHMAVVRNGANLSIYKNGLSAGGITNAGVFNFTGTVGVIGRFAATGATRFFNGSISNLRVVASAALYTANFTPSSSPFTNIANTSLLTLQDNRFSDNSNNNLTISAAGSVAIQDVSPFTQVTINPNIHGGSAFFGKSPYLITSDTTNTNAFKLSGVSFTLECWVYPISLNAAGTAMGILNICQAGDPFGINLYADGSQIRFDNGVDFNIGSVTNTAPFNINRWIHLAVSRDHAANITRLYVNGLSAASYTGVQTTYSPTRLIVGSYSTATTINLFNGYISNVRLVKGTALYNTASFTVSSSPLTNISGTSLLLNTSNMGFKTSVTETYAISSFTSFDGSNNLLTRHPQNWQILKLTNPLSSNKGDVINYTLSTSSPSQLSLMGAASATDTTGVNRLSTVGSPTLTSFKPYSNFDDSIYLNGTSTWFSAVANPNFNFTGDFTIEGWINTSVSTLGGANSRTVISFGPYALNNLSIIQGNAAGASANLSIYAVTTTNIVSGNIPTADGVWHHFAAVRFNNTVKLFIDGNQSGNSTSSTINYNSGVSNSLSIGSYNNSTAGVFNGYINNLRIVNGTAVYTTSSFSPPTTPLTVIPNTVFLLKNGARYDQALISNNNLALTGSIILNNITLSSVPVPFGTGLHDAFRFNGNNSYITFPANNWFTGDFNIELFLYWTGGAGQNNLLTGGTNLNIPLDLAASWGIGNSSSIQNNFGSPLTKNVWHHIIISKFNGVVRCFVDGIKIHEGANSTVYSNNNTVTVGYADGSNYMNGFISNIRITNKPTYVEVSSAIRIPTVPLNLTFETNALLNSNNFNLSSYNFSNIKLDDIHIGGALKGLNTEPCTITVDNFNLQNVYIHNQGTLTFPLSNTTLNVNGFAGLQITSDGTLNIGTSSASIPLSTTHTINLSNTQIDVHNGGNFNVYGFPETTTTNLVSTHPIGSRVFTVTNTVSNNWRVGDILSFKPNLSARTSFDTLILSSFIAPNVFTTTSSSLCTHTGSADQFAFIPDVYNLTRNVTIQGLNSTTRGVIRTIDAAKTNVNYAQLSNFGINSLNKTGFVLGNNSSGNTILSGIVINSDNTTTVNNIAPLTGRFFQNVTINNSIINRSNTITISSLSVNNINVSNNYILSSGGTGLNLTNLSGSINMSNNTVVGSLSVGTNLVNISLSGTYGALNYNSGLQGMLVSGTNTGTIIGGSINSAREGVYVDASTSNLSSLTFRNIIANNNSSAGFRVSGNNLNYLTPISLNVNGLTANSNLNNGFEAYNIIGNLSSLIITNNVNTNIRTSIGNGPTTFNGLTSLVNNSPTISSGIALLNSPTAVSSLSSPPYSGGIEGSLYFTGNAYANLPYSFNVMTDTVTLEGWIYVQTYATSWISFTTFPASNRTTNYNGILGINSTGRLEFYNYLGNPASMISTSSVQLSSWTHFAITLSAKVIKFYINGVEVSPAANTIITSTQVTTVNSMLGSQLNSEAAMQFFISNYRISNNLRYNGNFSVPSFPIVNADANTLLLYKNPYNNTFLTSSVNTNNLNVNILSGYNYSRIYIKNASIGKFDTYSSLSAQLIMDSTRFSNFSLENSVVTGGGLVNPILLNATRNLIEGSYLFNNTNLGSINFIDLTKYQPSVTRTSGFGFTNHNKIAGNHFTYLPMGLKAADTSLYDTSTSDLISERLTPTSRTMKLCSGTKYVALNSGETTLVKVNILVSSLYTGNLPRLMLRRNAAAGVYSDTILSVFNPNLGYDTFVQLVGVQTPAVIDNAVLEFYVDCDGTTGYVCVDTWTAN